MATVPNGAPDCKQGEWWMGERAFPFDVARGPSTIGRWENREADVEKFAFVLLAYGSSYPKVIGALIPNDFDCLVLTVAGQEQTCSLLTK